MNSWSPASRNSSSLTPTFLYWLGRSIGSFPSFRAVSTFFLVRLNLPRLAFLQDPHSFNFFTSPIRLFTLKSAKCESMLQSAFSLRSSPFYSPITLISWVGNQGSAANERQTKALTKLSAQQLLLFMKLLSLSSQAIATAIKLSKFLPIFRTSAPVCTLLMNFQILQ